MDAPCISPLKGHHEKNHSSHPSGELPILWLLQWLEPSKWSLSLLLEKMSHCNQSCGFVEILWKPILPYTLSPICLLSSWSSRPIYIWKASDMMEMEPSPKSSSTPLS